MATRRRFLAGLAAAGLTAPVSSLWNASAWGGSPDRPLFVSAFADAQMQMKLAGFDRHGKILFEHALPGRGHALALHPNRPEIVAFARRPGRFLQVMDGRTGDLIRERVSPEGRHFYGHGVFSPDGRYLYTAENDFVEERGVIGVWDIAAEYKRIGEFSAHGLGPHEILFMPDGETLAVAIGGILTHPDEGRAKLNIPEMSPALVYVNAQSGQLVSRHQLPLRQRKLSLRHMSVSEDGLVCFGLQNEGPKWEYPALVGTHRLGEKLRLLEAPVQIWQGMKNYCGSVAFDNTGQIVAASSPRGGLISFWEAKTGQHLYAAQAEDGCGIAPDGKEGSFLITCGTGEILRVDVPRRMTVTLQTGAQSERHWDNHLLALI